MLKLIKLIDVLDNALLAAMNEGEFCHVDSNGKLFIDLEKKKVQECLLYIGKSYVKANKMFGASNVIVESCFPNNNWRKSEINITISEHKYKIVDNSVNIDLSFLEVFSNKLMNVLKKEDITVNYVIGETIDFIDFKGITEAKFGFECLNNVSSKNFILSDNNSSFPHGKVFYEEQILEVEMVLMHNGLY